MNSKKLNILIIFCLTLFCFAGGFFGVYKFNQFKALDIAHDMQNASHRQQAEQESLNNIKTQSTNETNNNINILKPNVSTSSFFTFMRHQIFSPFLWRSSIVIFL